MSRVSKVIGLGLGLVLGLGLGLVLPIGIGVSIDNLWFPLRLE